MGGPGWGVHAGMRSLREHCRVPADSLRRAAACALPHARLRCTDHISLLRLAPRAQAVRGVATLALADAQSLSMLRAVQKGNAPDLISAIAVDTQALYAQAAAQVGAGLRSLVLRLLLRPGARGRHSSCSKTFVLSLRKQQACAA